MSDGFDNDPIIIDISSDVSDAESARKALAAVDVEVAKLRSEMNAGRVSLDRYLDGMDQLTAKKGALNDWFNSASTALKGTADATHFNTNKLSIFAGALDDLQYVPEMGLRPILNNLTQISPALAIAGIAAQTLLSHLGDIGGWVGQGHIKTAAEEMKELGDKTQRTADEQDRLNKLKRAEAVGKAIDEGQPEAEKKSQDATTKAFAEAGAPELRRHIMDHAPDLTRGDPDLADARRKLAENTKYIADRQKLADTTDDPEQANRAGRDVAAAQQHRVELQKKLAAAEEAAADKAVKDAALYDNARKRLIDAIEQNVDAFGPKGAKLLADLKLIQQGIDPANAAKDAGKADKKNDKAESKAAADAANAGYEAIDEAIEEADKRSTELAKNIQGRFNVASAKGGGDDAVDQDLIAEELENAGLSEADVKLYTSAVLDKLQDGYNKELEERAGKLGTNRAGAADSIIAEDDKKKADRAEKEQRDHDQAIDRARQGAEKAEADRADRLKRMTAGSNLDGQTRSALMRAELGRNPEQAAERIGQDLASRLQQGGMGERDARLAATQYVEDQRNKLRDEVGREAMKGPDGVETKGPEQRDFASFASSLTLGDIPKQTLDVTKQMLEVLANIERKTGAARLAP